MKLFLRALILCSLVLSLPHAALAQNASEITEITYEMTPGSSDRTRAFKITLRQDGTALYNGISNMKMEGKFKGTIAKEDFERLAALITERKFTEMKTLLPSSRGANALQLGLFIAPTVMTGIVQKGKRLTVERALHIKINQPDAPPKALLEIENAISAAATKIKWEKDK